MGNSKNSGISANATIYLLSYGYYGRRIRIDFKLPKIKIEIFGRHIGYAVLNFENLIFRTAKGRNIWTILFCFVLQSRITEIPIESNFWMGVYT